MVTNDFCDMQNHQKLALFWQISKFGAINGEIVQIFLNILKIQIISDRTTPKSAYKDHTSIVQEAFKVGDSFFSEKGSSQNLLKKEDNFL